MKFVVSGHLALDLIDQQLDFWQTMKDVWQRCDVQATDDLATVICKLYIRESSVANVCKAVREMGLAEKGFNTNDVSDTIRSCKITDEALKECALALLDSNWKQVQKFT